MAEPTGLTEMRCEQEDGSITEHALCERCRAALREAEAQRDAAQQGWAWALTERNRARQAHEDADAALQSLMAKYVPNEYRQALQVALDHVFELEEAWARGALDEHDGRGGERSNRNAQVRVALRVALRVEQPRQEDVCPSCGGTEGQMGKDHVQRSLRAVAEPEREGAER